MKNLKMAALSVVMLLMLGCATSVSPIPGLDIGFSARPEAVGFNLGVNPVTTGCELAKLVSWNYMENLICPKVEGPTRVPPPEVVPIEE